jgi:hypothetical protein
MGWGSWDPTPIFGCDYSVDDELRVAWQQVKTVAQPRSWRMMASLLGIITLS